MTATAATFNFVLKTNFSEVIKGSLAEMHKVTSELLMQYLNRSNAFSVTVPTAIKGLIGAI